MEISDGPSQQSAFNLDEIYKIIGHLYLESHHRCKTAEEHATSIIEQLEGQRAALLKDLEKRDEIIAKLQSGA